LYPSTHYLSDEVKEDRWSGQAERMGEMKKAYTITVKTVGYRPLQIYA